MTNNRGFIRRGVLAGLMASGAGAAYAGGALRLRRGRTADASPASPESYDYLINNLAELRAVNLTAVAVSLGKGAGQTLTVALAPGNYFPSGAELWAWNITSAYASANGADVTFTGQYSNNIPVIDVIKWDSAMTNQVRFRHMWICTRRWEPFSPTYASGATAGQATSFSQNLNGAFFINGSTGLPPFFEAGIKFTGNYRGDHTHEYDPTGVYVSAGVTENRYPESANIKTTLSGTSIATLTIAEDNPGGGAEIHIHRYVGDNCPAAWLDGVTGMIADGEWPLMLHPDAAATGTGFEGYFTTANGRIVSTRLVNGGTGYNVSTKIIQWWIWWDKKRTFVSWLPSACVRSYGGSGFINGIIRYTGVTFANSYTGIRLTPVNSSGEMYVHDCLFDRLYSDGMIVSNTNATRSKLTSVIGNVFKENWAIGSDPCDPHADHFQPFQSGAFTRPINIVFAGNILLPGRTRGGGPSGILVTDLIAGAAGISGYFVANYILTRQQGNVAAFEQTGDLMFSNNLVLRYDVSETGYNSLAGLVALANAVASVTAKNNVVEGIGVTGGSAKADLTGNTVVGHNGVTIPYASVVASPLSRPLTRATIRTAFATIGAYTGMGPEAGGVFNWTTLAVNYDAIPAAMIFESKIGQDPAAAGFTPWTRMFGGLATGDVSITGTGMSFQLADDDLGTGATAQLTNFTGVKRTGSTDKWIRLKCDAMTTGLTNRTATLTVDGTAMTWSITSASLLSYTKVDNQSAAYSDIIIPSQSGLLVDRMLIAAYMDIDAMVSTSRLLTGTHATLNGQSFLLNFSATLATAQLGSSGAVARRRLTATPTLDTDQLWVWLLDLTKTDNNRMLWMVNDTLPAVDNIINGVHASVNIDNTMATPYRLFASVSAAQIMDIKPSMFYLDWGRSVDGYTLPDVSTLAARQTLFNSFQRDLIGATGNGPSGSQPKLCFYGAAGASDGSTADTWNATGGLTNRGSLSTAAIKTAGTYV